MDTILRAATVGETADVASNVSAAIRKAAIEDDYLTNENALLKGQAEKMVAGLGTIRSKELTIAMDTADSLRDSLLGALIHLLKGFFQWNKTETIVAASLLLKIVKAHGNNFSRLGNEKESAVYDSLLGEFEKEDSVAAFATLGLTQLFTDMKDAEANFKSLYRQSAEIESGKTDTVVPSSIKRETQLVLNELIVYLDAMNKAKASVYGALAANVAELVDTVNAKVRNRIATPKDAEETPPANN